MEEALHDTSVQKEREIQEQFDRSLAAIDEKINVWYRRLADNNGVSMQEARKMLNAGELKEFQWSVEEYIKYGKENDGTGAWMKQLENASAKVHISRLESLKIQTQQEIEKLYGNYHKSADAHFSHVYTSQYYHTAFEVQRGIGVGWHMQGFNQTQVGYVIHKPWAVDGRNFSERIWTDKTKLINNLHNSLTRMCITGESPDRAIREIAQNMKVSKTQAARIIQTESAAFAAKAQEQCFSDLDVEKIEVVETLDSHTCPKCGEMDGKHFSMKDYEIGVTVPPFHPNCRGCTCPFFDDEFDSVGKRAARGADGKTYYVPSDMTYEEWKEQCVDKGPEEKETDEKKTTDYLIRSHIPRQNVTKERALVNEVVATMPAKVQRALRNTVIDVGKDGASQYDYIHDILYVAQGAEKDGIVHEIGHMVENKLLDEEKITTLRKRLLQTIAPNDIVKESMYDAAGQEHEVFIIISDSFVSEYQGRIYVNDWDEIYDENWNIRDDKMWEFMAEPFREYIENPGRLEKNFPEFYDLIKEAVE